MAEGKEVLLRAARRAGISYVRPYSPSFAAWAMTIRTDISKLERLMGHCSQEMLYNIYGKYVEGLENDAEAILDYLGEDFLRSVRLPSPAAFVCSESYSENGGDRVCA